MLPIIIFFLGSAVAGVSVPMESHYIFGVGLALMLLAAAGKFLKIVLSAVVVSAIAVLLFPPVLPVVLALGALLGVHLLVLGDGLKLA